MASKTREISLGANPNDAYVLMKNSGVELPGFSLSWEDPGRYYLKFARGFGWTNPVDIEVNIYQQDATSAQLRLNASILALADPFGFMDSALDMFETHLRAHHQAWQQGVRPPPPPKDTRAMKVNLILIGGILGFVFLCFAFVVLMMVLR